MAVDSQRPVCRAAERRWLAARLRALTFERAFSGLCRLPSTRLRRRAGRVVADADAGGWEDSGGDVALGGNEGVDRDAGGGGELGGGDGAGAVEDHRGLGGVEDGGFEADGGGAGVEDGVDAAVEVGEDVRGGGGAGVAEEVGAGRGDGQSGGFEAEHVRRGATGTRTPTSSLPAVTASGMAALRGSSSVSGPGQKAEARFEMLGSRAAGMLVMVESWAAEAMWTMSGSQAGRCLAAKMRSDRVGREGVGAEAVDGLGGEGDQAAFAEELGGAGDVGGVGWRRDGGSSARC